MNTASLHLRLTRLATGQLGVRATVPVAVTPDPHGDDDFMIIRVSDETLDRYGEIIAASGWKLDQYRRNPVIQNCHQYGDVVFTIGRAVRTWVQDHALYQEWQFAAVENPLAKIARDLYRGGFLRAASVGFIPFRWEDNTETNGSSRAGWRRRYTEQELIEVSAVAIPANPNALALGLDSGAVDLRDLKELAAMLKDALRLHHDFRNHPADPHANARASGWEIYEAQWLQLLRDIHQVSRRN